MIRERVKEYFSFTRKERIGVVVLVFLIFIIFLLPVFFNSQKNTTDLHFVRQFKNEIAQLKTIQQKDSTYFSRTDHDSIDKQNLNVEKSVPEHHTNPKTHLFFFDPNTISSTQWEELGIKAKTIHIIEHYISRGGRFNKPEDLKRIYGMNETDYQLLLPFVEIKKSSYKSKNDTERSFTQKEQNLFYHESGVIKIEINTADSSSLMALPGIGIKLASRILRFREKLGGFYGVDQVAETYGLPDSVYRKIRPFLYLNQDSVKQININTADIPLLAQHPYIRWDIARVIVQYREAHGAYKSVEELGQIAILKGEKLQKMAPYLKIN